MKHETLKKELKGMLRQGNLEAVVNRLEGLVQEQEFSTLENLVSQVIVSHKNLSGNIAAGLLNEEQKALATDKISFRLFKVIDLLDQPEKATQMETLLDRSSIENKSNSATLTGKEGIVVQGSQHTSINTNKGTEPNSTIWILVIIVLILLMLYTYFYLS